MQHFWSAVKTWLPFASEETIQFTQAFCLSLFLLPVTDVGFVWVWCFFIALTEEKVGWGDDSKGLSSVPSDLKMQQSKQPSGSVVSLRTKGTLEVGC